MLVAVDWSLKGGGRGVSGDRSGAGDSRSLEEGCEGWKPSTKSLSSFIKKNPLF